MKQTAIIVLLLLALLPYSAQSAIRSTTIAVNTNGLLIGSDTNFFSNNGIYITNTLNALGYSQTNYVLSVTNGLATTNYVNTATNNLVSNNQTNVTLSGTFTGNGNGLTNTTLNGLVVNTNSSVTPGVVGCSVMSVVGGTNYWVNDKSGIFVTNHIP